MGSFLEFLESKLFFRIQNKPHEKQNFLIAIHLFIKIQHEQNSKR